MFSIMQNMEVGVWKHVYLFGIIVNQLTSEAGRSRASVICVVILAVAVAVAIRTAAFDKMALTATTFLYSGRNVVPLW